ncbi:MAG: hypothetical protein RL669_1145 [Pseudomonadota bacterium]|jgi:soluble lytic murein transglycosylase-like protein
MPAQGAPFRRRALLGAAAALALATLPRRARAGAQQYEPMAEAVRNALAAQLADPQAPRRSFPDHAARMAYVDWLEAMSARLASRKPDLVVRHDFLRTLDYECTRAGLDRQLVLALVQVESNFRKYAVSSAGARGYMQVMPFWTRVIGNGDERSLFDMRTNLRYGCLILRHYQDIERGDLFLALGRYNGSRGRPEYPDAVFAALKQRWTYSA